MTVIEIFSKNVAHLLKIAYLCSRNKIKGVNL